MKKTNFFKITSLVAHRQKRRHGSWITPLHSTSFFRERRGKRSRRSINPGNAGWLQRNLLTPSFRDCSAPSSVCSAGLEATRSGVPHDQLLHLSNLQHHHLLVSDLSPRNISSHPLNLLCQHCSRWAAVACFREAEFSFILDKMSVYVFVPNYHRIGMWQQNSPMVRLWTVSRGEVAPGWALTRCTISENLQLLAVLMVLITTHDHPLSWVIYWSSQTSSRSIDGGTFHVLAAGARQDTFDCTSQLILFAKD